MFLKVPKAAFRDIQCSVSPFMSHPSDNGADDGGYAGYDSEDDGGDIGSRGPSIPFSAQDGRGPSLEELLQPPRRVRQYTVKYDKTAGVADVASLKASIEVSLKYVVATLSFPNAPSCLPVKLYRLACSQLHCLAPPSLLVTLPS